MGKRNMYLSSKELEFALNEYMACLKDYLETGVSEEMETAGALGRITGEPVFARVSSPNFNASAMDGIAVKAEKTFGASERNRIRLKEGPDYTVVDTGDPIPQDYNAVIMVEDLIEIGKGEMEIVSGATPWQNIRPIGEDIVQGELIVPSYHRIRPVDIGAMLAGGVNRVKVLAKPNVAIIPTGTELVMPGQPLDEGSIIEFNSHIFAGLITEWGGVPERMTPIPDDYNRIRSAIKECCERYDMVLVNAGSSAGREDFTKDIVQDLGEVITHGLAIKPGKPAILGKVYGKPVIGIPGYPVSAFIVMENIVKPLVQRFLHIAHKPGPEVEAICSRRIVSSLKNKEFVRMKLGKVDDKMIATPLTRGAGVVMSLVRADGILELPQNSEGLEAGDRVRVRLVRELSAIEDTIVCIGSHDPLLDILANEIHIFNPGLSFASAHVGSMGGLTALRKGETHVAGVHLLDEQTGGYNIPYIKRLFDKDEIALIKMVNRVQGLIVKKGNPKNILKFTDLVRPDVNFVNRQKGSGTRMLLDFNLRKEGIEPERIKGYGREEYTHMAVAAAVAFSNIDVGLGIYSSAISLDLGFVPLYHEEYDLAVPVRFLEKDNIRAMLKVIRDKKFKQKIDTMGGYETARMGEIVYLG